MHLRVLSRLFRFLLAVCLACVVAAVHRDAAAHPWHRHRERLTADRQGADGEPRPATPFRLTAAPQKPGGAAVEIADAFAAFEKLGAVKCRRDERWLYVESRGIPDHPLMVGIRNWQQQVPLPQPYVGDNAWQIPLRPVPAAEPATTRNRFLRGAIAVAVNGIPIFNPLNNRGEDAFAIGELDDYGGHCGRADDYHYHVAPVHLEKVVGKGMPIAYALDGYPIYGYAEPDGSPVKPLDALGGHEDAQGNYHYHATRKYPYLNGGFRGEVTEREGQVDPQPRAQPLREALPPLRGATIIRFDAPRADTRRLTYELGGRTGTVEYRVAADGSADFTSSDPAGRTTKETYSPRGRGGSEPGGGPPRRPGPPGDHRPRPNDEPAPAARRSAGQNGGRSDEGIVVTSPAIAADGNLPAEFTCDGAGVSPPVEWTAGPPGTTSYALALWHEAPDRVKSYWVVHGIPATVRSLPKAFRGIGTVGLNDKRRADYDPMCSKGPGRKTYHLTVYALSAPPSLPAGGGTRDALLVAIRQTTLAQGTLTFAYERPGSR